MFKKTKKIENKFKKICEYIGYDQCDYNDIDIFSHDFIDLYCIALWKKLLESDYRKGFKSFFRIDYKEMKNDLVIADDRIGFLYDNLFRYEQKEKI